MPIALLQRPDALERLACLHFGPVSLEFATVLGRPVADEASRCTGADLTSQHVAGEQKRSLLTLLVRMEVSRLVLLVVHPDHDSEEGRDDRHKGVYRFALLVSA